VVGAKVWLDDVLAGTTGEGGQLLVEGDAPPEKVRVWRFGRVLERGLATDPTTDQLLPGSRRSGDLLIFILAPKGE
jgi:hypothetical protein